MTTHSVTFTKTLLTPSLEKSEPSSSFNLEDIYRGNAFDLGEIYRKGTLVKKDLKKAIYHYKHAAAQGHLQAQLQLGYWYFNGLEDVMEISDFVRARHYFTKASEKENADAQYHLGILYLNGTGVEKNKFTAFNYLKRAADNGHGDAQFKVATMYATGGVGIAHQDPELAEHYFVKAAAQGHLESCATLHRMYFHGIDVEKDYKKSYAYGLQIIGKAVDRFFLLG